MAQEQEIKLQLTAGEAALLEKQLGPPQMVARQENYYLDTVGGHLRNDHYGLRLRHETRVPGAPGSRSAAEHYSLTFKGPSIRSGSVHVRREEEAEISHTQAERILAEGLTPATAQLAEFAAVAERLAIGRVVCLGQISNERRVLIARLPGRHETLRLELDRTRFPDGSTDHELECEFPPGETVDAADLRGVEEALRGLLATFGVSWRPSTRGKYARFLQRRRP